MDEDEFEDLFAGGDMLEGSSQESLTATGADLTCDDDDMLLDEVDGESIAIIHDAHERGYRGHSNNRSERTATPRPDKRASEEPSAHSPAEPHLQTSVIDKIEHVFEKIARALLNNEKELCVTIKQRAPLGDGSVLQKTAAERWAEAKSRRICFPGKTADEAWRFTVVIRILELVHEALRSEVTLSKRDIYYRDPALFGSQTHVDRYVDDIAFTFGVSRSALNITAVAKGLVAGAFSICRRDGSTLDGRADREGILVPSLRDVLSVNMKAVKWILVIEKEASFRSLAASPFWQRIESKGVIITGKGYPDIATRALLRYISMPSPQNGFASPPVRALMDFDPDGLAILSVYKHGSNALAHENADLVVPQISHLGLRSKHVFLGIGNEAAAQGLLAMSARDRRTALKMLGRECEDEVRMELQRMLMLGVKAELQLLDAVPGGMQQMLERELAGSVK